MWQLKDGAKQKIAIQFDIVVKVDFHLRIARPISENHL